MTQAIEGEGIKGEAGRVGAGAGVGAIIGGILGGFKGALAGILIGGGGTIAATEGKEVELPQGTCCACGSDSGRLQIRIRSVHGPRPSDGRLTCSSCTSFIAACAAAIVLSTSRVGVRRRQEPRLELRRRRIDAARQHAVEERRVRAGVGAQRRLIVAHRRGREERRQRATRTR